MLHTYFIITDMHVQLMDQKYCVQQVLENMLVEQPYVAYSLHENPSEMGSIFCAGYNHTYDFSQDEFVELVSGRLFR